MAGWVRNSEEAEVEPQPNTAKRCRSAEQYEGRRVSRAPKVAAFASADGVVEWWSDYPQDFPGGIRDFSEHKIAEILWFRQESQFEI